MADKTLLHVKVMTPERLVFDGKVESVILPGERGVFEVAAHHKRLLSRLIHGRMFIGNTKVEIRRGVVKVGLNEVIVIVEEP
jgi:F-type H+-transporting ATPase subunit epsilon